MSIAKHHNEWLSLIDISGPFLSLKVLTDRFPQGLPTVAADLRSDLRAAYEEWADNQRGLQQEPAIHQAWFDFVFTDLLGYPARLFRPCPADDCPAEWQATLAERQISLRPDFVLRHPNEAQPRLLVMTLPSHQGLEKRSKEAYTAANDLSPATQMLELLRATGVPLGLATNGGEWLLVYTVPGEAASYATWKTELWLDEPLTLHAFNALLNLGRFFGVPDDETLPALLAASKDNQHDVTDQLGLQTRHAVEILVQAIAKADMDRQGRLLAAIDERTLYEAALTVMMRLVFLLSAEEQGLLLLGDPIYDQNYAISTLRAQLREAADQVGEEVIQRRTDAWARLLATFRAVYHGVWHPQLGLPAYGGSLFDPERFPFLEGRAAEQPDGPVNPLPIDNRTVLHLLQALQQLELRAGGVTTLRTLSFRALDVEQIGHVYEGLLDHQAVRATEVVLGLEGAAGLEPEIPLATLAIEAAKGETALVDFLAATTKRSKAALARALAGELSDWRHGRFLTACGGDERLLERLLPFAGLVRDDTRQEPLVILPGEVYVTAGLTRRQTGSHYTPRSLTEPIVQHTLEPLVYVGPAEGLPREQWRLKGAADLLQLKVCDMAMGSGAFLVQACRYLAERLLEAWQAEETIEEVAPEEVASSDATRRGGRRASEDARLLGLEPTADRPFAGPFAAQNLDELYTLAKRLVAERCLYGVDKNPLAVEMAKLSLWLVTLSKNKPFTFLNHALRHGDSLIGIDEDTFYRWSHTDKTPRGTLLDEENRRILAEVKELRKQIQEMTVLDVRDAQEKERLLAEADAKKERLILGANFLVGLELLDWKSPQLKSYHKDAVKLEGLIAFQAGNDFSTAGKAAVKAAKKYDAFHWFVEFPEVFAQGGFSAFMGNPPFIGGKRIRASLGEHYNNFIREFVARNKKGIADLSAYFLLRAFSHLNPKGVFGLIATSSISEGDTRTLGLEQLIQFGGNIYRTYPKFEWPGQAAVFVSIVYLSKFKWSSLKFINKTKCDEISSYLTSEISFQEPYTLSQNKNSSSRGTYVYGKGFVISPPEKNGFVSTYPENIQVIQPYLSGADLNSNHDQFPSRWVINFHDMSEQEAQKYRSPYLHLVETVKPKRDQLTGQIHESCFWKHWDRREWVYSAIEKKQIVLVCASVTKYFAFCFVPSDWVYSDKVTIFPFADSSTFAHLQSSLHDSWCRQFTTTIGTGVNYNTKSCYETFPFPIEVERKKSTVVEVSGHEYHKYRHQLMLDRQEGLTATYNRFHNPAETTSDIAHLRRLHLEMDNAVAAAYGWADLDLGHGFHETAQGLRYTISEPARREALTRLLQLNHQRYEEEVAAGLHEKGKEAAPKSVAPKGAAAKGVATKGKKPSKKNDGQLSMF